MMKTRLARTVVRLVTANTTVLSSEISLQTSFVESAVTLDIWPRIVLTDSAVPTIATCLLLQEDQALVLLAESVQVTQLTRNTR